MVVSAHHDQVTGLDAGAAQRLGDMPAITRQGKATVFSYLNHRGSNYVAKLARYDMALERGEHGCYAMSNNIRAEGGDRYGKAATRNAEKECSDTDKGRRNGDPDWNQLCIRV